MRTPVPAAALLLLACSALAQPAPLVRIGMQAVGVHGHLVFDVVPRYPAPSLSFPAP